MDPSRNGAACHCSPCFSRCWRSLTGDRNLFLAFRFSLLFFFVHTSPDRDQPYITCPAIWFTHPRLIRIGLGPIPGHWFRSGPMPGLAWAYADIILNCPSIRIYWAGWSNWICLFDVRESEERFQSSRSIRFARRSQSLEKNCIVVDFFDLSIAKE